MLIPLKPSRLLLLFWVLLSLGAGLCIIYSTLSFFIQIPLILLLLSYAGRVLWQDILLKSQRAVVALSHYEDNSWQLEQGLGTLSLARLEGGSVLTAYFCFLRFRLMENQQKRSCLILYDALDPRHFQRLSIHLSTLKV